MSQHTCLTFCKENDNIAPAKSYNPKEGERKEIVRFDRVSVQTRYLHGVPCVLPGVGAWAKLELNGGHPNEIVLNVGVNDVDCATIGIYMDSTKGDLPYEEGPRFTLRVPIVWKNGIPHTRSARGNEQDNFDVVIFEPSAHFTEIQAGLVSRGGALFLTLEKVWRGWIQFRDDGEGKETAEFLPSDPEHAYPDADYRRIWDGTDKIVRFAGSIVKATIETLGGKFLVPEAASWQPAEISVLDGWKRGTVLYFNFITGTGLILGEDGQRHFVHFRQIIAEGEMKVLSPMSGVYFRPGNPSTPGQLPKVKSCKQA